MEKTTKQVRKVLRNSGLSRNSDKELIVLFLFMHTPMKQFDAKIKDKIRKIFHVDLPPIETITRARREIQKAGFYKASAKTQSERIQKEKQLRKYFR